MAAASRAEIQSWFERGRGVAIHMLVVIDTFGHDDFPAYVYEGQDVHEKIDLYDDPDRMSKVMEVYDLNADMQEQLDLTRAWSVPEKRADRAEEREVTVRRRDLVALLDGYRTATSAVGVAGIRMGSYPADDVIRASLDIADDAYDRLREVITEMRETSRGGV